MSYQVKLETFEGPLDLLLFLIKRNDLDIYDIPISQITAEYVKYLDMMRLLNLEITGDFLVMAATLIHIKSKMLLPVSETEDEDIEDPRKELVDKLVEYKKFKKVATVLCEKEVDQRNVFYRDIPVSFNGDYVLEVSLFDLLSSFKKVLLSTPKGKIKDIIGEEITIEQKMKELLYKLESENYISFWGIFKDSITKQDIIVTLLALLELIRLGQIFARQEQLFGNIRIYKANNMSDGLIEENEEPKENKEDKDLALRELAEKEVLRRVNYNASAVNAE